MLVDWDARGETLPVGGGGVRAAGGSHLLDRSLLKERNKRISSRYVNVNLQREKERKRTNTEANGQVSTDQTGRGTVSGSVSSIQGRRASVVWSGGQRRSGVFIHVLGPHSNHFTASIQQPSDMTGRRNHQEGGGGRRRQATEVVRFVRQVVSALPPSPLAAAPKTQGSS